MSFIISTMTSAAFSVVAYYGSRYLFNKAVDKVSEKVVQGSIDMSKMAVNVVYKKITNKHDKSTEEEDEFDLIEKDEEGAIRIISMIN